MTAHEPVICLALRTAFAPMGKEFASWDAAGLAQVCIREAVSRLSLDPVRIDEVILGCAGNPLDSANIARVAALRAGLPNEVTAHTVQRNCASGMDAIAHAATMIKAGEAEIVLAGGVEHMSGYPLLFNRLATDIFTRLAREKSAMKRAKLMASLRPRHFKPLPALIAGMRDPSCGLSMGETAELLANELGLTRDEQDAFALTSQQRAAEAARSGTLSNEIIPVIPPPRYDAALLEDTGIRDDSSMEKLGRLRTVFDRKHGTVTAGNSSQLTDGAAITVVTTRSTAGREGWPVLGRIAAWHVSGVDPARMGLGPVVAAPAACKKAGIDLASCGVIELNEAFAAQALACLQMLDEKHGEIDRMRVNPHGGAIARGHPLGATGARLVGAVLHELHRRSERWGLATLCVGGGQGAAMVLEAGS